MSKAEQLIDSVLAEGGVKKRPGKSYDRSGSMTDIPNLVFSPTTMIPVGAWWEAHWFEQDEDSEGQLAIHFGDNTYEDRYTVYVLNMDARKSEAALKRVTTIATALRLPGAFSQ